MHARRLPIGAFLPPRSGIARLELATLPTPVHPLARLARAYGRAVWIKRDDLSSGHYGGAKVRKLEWELGRAKQMDADAVVTAGPAGSNHLLATALFARKLDLRAVCLIKRGAVSSQGRRNLHLTHAAGAQLVVCEPGISLRRASAAVCLQMEELERAGNAPYFIPFGGGSPLGALGYVNAGLELAHQVNDGRVPAPRAIYMASATGGTAAGLQVGLALAGLNTHLVVADVGGGAVIPDEVAKLVDLLGQHGVRVRGEALLSSQLTIRREEGVCYGESTPAALDATALLERMEGLQLEELYTGRAFASLLADLQGGPPSEAPVLFWHTAAGAGFGATGDDAPLPPELEDCLGRDATSDAGSAASAASEAAPPAPATARAALSSPRSVPAPGGRSPRSPPPVAGAGRAEPGTRPDRPR
jgi:D-cysteine desulfhydrase